MYSEIRFGLGRIAVTRNAKREVGEMDIIKALGLHARGDWGLITPDDWRANDEALADGGGLLSVYQSSTDRRFWIITERDRSATTVMLPEDY